MAYESLWTLGLICLQGWSLAPRSCVLRSVVTWPSALGRLHTTWYSVLLFSVSDTFLCSTKGCRGQVASPSVLLKSYKTLPLPQKLPWPALSWGNSLPASVLPPLTLPLSLCMSSFLISSNGGKFLRRRDWYIWCTQALVKNWMKVDGGWINACITGWGDDELVLII